MTTLKAVIGANYGDEGKGKMTDYFAYKSEKKCIVVCSNGGAQRGHTVLTIDKGQHIFHHFGSGTFAEADTYLPSQYIVNPMIFMKEYREIYPVNSQVYVNENALCSTPYDMIVNQIIEESRGINKHGSCGVGIWETILRNEATIGDMLRMTYDQMKRYLQGVRDSYYLLRLKSKHIDIPSNWESVFFNDNLIENYIYDFQYMVRYMTFTTDDILKRYSTVIFENGQGLLLDQNIKNSQYSTPSNTGSKNIKKMVQDVFGDEYEMEVCYVTRSYLTRHGVGEFPSEILMPRFKLDTLSETNTWNKNQGSFRYGILNVDELIDRITEDYNYYWNIKQSSMSLAITHWDENQIDTSNIKCKIYYGIGAERTAIMCETAQCK